MSESQKKGFLIYFKERMSDHEMRRKGWNPQHTPPHEETMVMMPEMMTGA